MTEFLKESDHRQLARSAYGLAWTAFNRMPNLCPDEKDIGPAMLHNYIETLVAAGERDVNKIAAIALGLIREHEQINRSRVRLEMSGSLPRTA